MYEKLKVVYFSATGNTKAYLEAMAAATHLPTEYVDVTTQTAAPEIFVQKNELLLLGAPNYSGRIPKLAAERFVNLKGEGSACVLVSCFGNRAVDDAYVEMEDIVKEKGFTVIGAAGLVGRHTFGEIAVDRPNAEDKKQAADFMQAVLEKTAIEPITLPGHRPYKAGGTGGKWRPETTEACVQCGLCVRNCPAHAIAKDCKTVDDNLCVSCFRCVRSCPKGAKQVTSEAYLDFAAMLNQKLAARQENEFYL